MGACTEVNTFSGGDRIKGSYMSGLDASLQSKKLNCKKIPSNLILFVILAVMVGVFSALSRDFYSYYNIVAILNNLAFTGIIAAALTLVMITGGLDMSVGGNIALTSCMVAAMYNLPNPPNMILVVFIGLLVGVFIGFFNGFLITRLNLNPVITTLGVMTMARGGAYVLSKGRSILVMENVTGFLGRGTVARIPMPLLFFILVYMVLAIILSRSKFGRKVYYIGANPEAARVSGINSRRIKTILYFLTGISASFSGLILTGMTAAGMPQHGAGTELDIISAVLLGGTALAGGKGSIVGTLAGVLILAVLYNGFTLIGIKWMPIRVFQGILLVGIVALYEARGKKRF
ncbi:MAG: ABC transporter permease [Spirochaetales bacterium]|nr:MAG: ABC transporter permease [Spirochaetales bacterium]